MTDDKVTTLRNANETPDEDVVAVLEEALALARSGRMRSVALAANLTGHATITAYATNDLQEAIGLVGFLHHTLCTKQYQTPGD